MPQTCTFKRQQKTHPFKKKLWIDVFSKEKNPCLFAHIPFQIWKIMPSIMLCTFHGILAAALSGQRLNAQG